MICQAPANTIYATANNFADIMLAMDFSDWLVDWLNKKGWTQSELANRAGVTRTAISDVISRRRNPGTDLCLAIARALDLPPEIVFRAAGLLPPAPSNTEFEEHFLHLLRQLPPKERQEILELLMFKTERTTQSKKSRQGAARMLLKDE